jgi:Na+/H+ antiporter NhaD/arsenite permease-like protein
VPPYWSVVPFALMLLSIAVLPLAVPHWWESNLHKGQVSAALGVVALLWLLLAAPEGATHRLAITALDYVAFIALLASLFVVSGGIYVRGAMRGTPGSNTALLAIGGLLASLMGTTGAAMLLIRPVLRANAWRDKRAHVIIFFIFVVANMGGLLTPLGDPPLYLGFLKGVPFEWTLGLWRQWGIAVACTLAVFYVVDMLRFRADARAGRTPPARSGATLGLDGTINLVWLLAIVGTIFGFGMLAKSHAIHELEKTRPLLAEILLKVGQAAVMGAVALASLRTTRKSVRAANAFSYGPIVEVAVLFAGIFLTMIPALWILDLLGQRGELGIDQPWQFFWATGSLSSLLDNAPTYLTFTAAASGLHQVDSAALSQLLASSGQAIPGSAALDPGSTFLGAISCGAVFMGAMTYIGNGPNFMVKAIAEQEGVRMPGFFGYMVWSCAFLLPLFVGMTWLFWS